MTPDRKPMFAKCGACEHIWAIVYMPMEATLAARCMKRATCPSCGEIKNIGIAKQDNGVLLEDARSATGGA